MLTIIFSPCVVGLATYIISIVYLWRWYHIAYGKNGIDGDVTPEPVDVVVIFVPIANSVIAFCRLFENPRRDKPNRAKKFFRIK